MHAIADGDLEGNLYFITEKKGKGMKERWEMCGERAGRTWKEASNFDICFIFKGLLNFQHLRLSLDIIVADVMSDLFCTGVNVIVGNAAGNPGFPHYLGQTGSESRWIVLSTVLIQGKMLVLCWSELCCEEQKSHWQFQRFRYQLYDKKDF